MVDSEEPNGKVWSRTRPHEEFLELCALSTTGALSAEEQKRLQEHLEVCSDCREAIKQFETVVDRAVPALASALAGEAPTEDPSFCQEAAEESFLKRLSDEQEKSQNNLGDAELSRFPLVVRRSRGFRRSFDRYQLWIPLAAGLLLCASLGVLAYRMGKREGVDVARLEQTVTRPGVAASQDALAAAMHESDAANAQLAERNKAIIELRQEIAEKTTENSKLTTSLSQRQAALDAAEKGHKQLTEERDRSAQEAAAGRAALEAAEKELSTLERDRSQDVIRATSLEAQVAELSGALKDQQRTASEQEELLAKDRDIRELMGARDLYVAEVHDVAGTGRTEKAFGRVFYTKGKSLIFYAYDLNNQQGLKEASTFEAWGRRGPDWSQAFKLGMFYEDNVARKRWVLKFNDKKTLDQIEAVFVTAEPHGGSEKPTGKPLLFAYLKVAPNHP